MMGSQLGSSCFVMGGTCFLQSLPISSSSSSSSSSCSSSSSQSLFLHSRHSGNVSKNKHRALTMACHQQESSKGVDFYKRRAILILGISSLQFLQLNARAADTLVKEKQGTWTPEENQNAQQLYQREASPNPFLSLLNVVGIVGSGVFGALYKLTQKEMITGEATIESLKNRLDDKETAMISVEKKLKKRLLDEQEERSRQIKKGMEAQLSLSNQLTSANTTASDLRKQLLTEKRLVEELTAQIGRLENVIKKAEDSNKMLEAKLQEKLESIDVLQDRINLLTLEIRDKEDNLQNVKDSLVAKESECENLDFVYKGAKSDLRKASSEIELLKQEVSKTREELDSKNCTVDDLSTRITLLASEKEDMSRIIKSLEEDYNDMKSYSENKTASDAELLGKKELELQKLEEKLGLALNEANSGKALISDLTQQRDDLQKLLEVEVNNVRNLKHELQIAQAALETSKVEASGLSKQLEQSRKSCQDLTSEMSRIQTVFAEARESLKKQVKEARSNSEQLSGELDSVEKDLLKTKQELGAVSDELAEVTETRESLKKELVDAYKKAELKATELEEERNLNASLHKELEASKKQILEDKEARQSLETDLEEATKALDEVNKNAILLSRELEMVNSKIEGLEADKDLLFDSLVGQKNATKEARENLEDAHSLIMKLGKERETLTNRGKRLEEELASAKGEILRMRSQMNSSSSPKNDVLHKKSEKAEGNSAVPVKKTRRRRIAPSSDAS